MPAVSGVLGRLESEVLYPAIAVIFAAGFLLFVWGLVKFLWTVEESSAQEEGKRHMLWGIVGMFIMVSFWSIIALLDNTFGLGATSGGGASTDPGRNQIQGVSFGQVGGGQ